METAIASIYAPLYKKMHAPKRWEKYGRIKRYETSKSALNG